MAAVCDQVRMRLYIFPISHFSEKARWAADHHGVDYELVRCVPGSHLVTMRRLGVRRTSVPVLVTDRGEAIQGSGRIISHLDEADPERSLTPSAGEWSPLEKRIDRDLGEGLRRIFYSEMMRPEAVIPLWSQDCAWWSPALLRMMFPVLKAKVTRAYRLYPDDVEAAKGRFDALFCELEESLGERSHFVGDRLSRIDIAVAALMAPMMMPPNHPFPWRGHGLPPSVGDFIAVYQGRPLWRWVERLYAEERMPS